MVVARSYLYVPGDQRDKLAKAVGRGADALVIDLEDAVAPGAKDAAREAVAEFLAAGRAGPELWVRVNADRLDADLPAVTAAACAGVWVPKAEPEMLARADALLTAAERNSGLAPGSVRIVPLVETARGLLAAADLAHAPRVLRLGIGEADLAAELGVQPGPDRAELAWHRAGLVVASAAARLAPPVAPVETDLAVGNERLAASTRGLLREGFRARTAVHPRQIPVINTVFTPSDAELAAAREVVGRLAAAERSGAGVCLDAGGRLIDEAVARSAREILGRAVAPLEPGAHMRGQRGQGRSG
jgi:citrate lyase subunit beta/citryl-CoA lyase